MRVPIIYTDRDTEIYMVYGNSSVTASTENPAGVWDSHYQGVWHLHETSGTHGDSTGNANDGTATGIGSQDETGQIDGTDYFDGDGEVDLDTVSGVDFGGSFSISAWIKTNNNNRGIFAKGDSDENWEADEKQFYLDGSGYVTFGNAGGVLNIRLICADVDCSNEEVDGALYDYMSST